MTSGATSGAAHSAHGTPWRRLQVWLSDPIDIASLAAFRIVFGATMAIGMVRFVASGWVDILYVQPRFFFKYPGFEWLEPFSPTAMTAIWLVVAAAAFTMSLGLFYRASAVVFTVGFALAQLFDLTNYLNHYYLVVLLGAILCVLPAHRAASLDAWRKPQLRSATAPRWAIALIRFQVATVYFYAALAKVGPDWLLHGQPLGIWLAARTELPVLGPIFALPWAPLAMSWAGFLYDLLIVPFLLWGRTRPYAFVAVLIFHSITHALFDIGMFPAIMTTSVLIFFSPQWPRRVFGRWDVFSRLSNGQPPAALPPQPHRPFSPLIAALLLCYVLFQALVPLRHFAYEGPVLWHERGMRWSWKVMVRSKRGSVEYRVKRPGEERERYVSPLDYLDWRQYNEMAGQPDMIAQLARHIAREIDDRGQGPVQVFADAWVSLNGRPPARLVDPTVDLSRAPDPLWGAAPDWILPSPQDAPLPSVGLAGR